MINRFLCLVLLFVLAAPINAQELSEEERAVKLVIENETKYFNEGPYEKWAECVAHDPMTYFSWTSPYAGENAIMEVKGWDEVSKFYRKMMSESSPNDGEWKKENYQFKISEDLAFVTFVQNKESMETRVLVKKNGKWRILRMEAVASKAFKKYHNLYALQRMAGTWEVDLASYKIEGGGDWTLLSGTIKAKATDYGLALSEHYDYKNSKGEHRSSKDSGMMALNMATSKIGVLFATTFPYSKWSRSAMGTGEMKNDGTLHIKGKMVGGEDEADVKYWLDGNDMKFAVVVKDDQGKQVYASSYTMKRKGLSNTIRP